MTTNEANMIMEQRFVALALEKKELKTKISHVQNEMSELEESILTHFEQASIDKLTILGVTLYVHRQLWASAKDGDKQRAVKALQMAGMDEFVTFNTQSVSALFREAFRAENTQTVNMAVATMEGTPLPETGDSIFPNTVRAAFEITEKIGLRTRKG